MGLIRLDKQYKKLFVVGCSFTDGYLVGKEASWGTHLANKLNCECVIRGVNSSSNFNMITEVLDICESNDMTNNCIGIQLSERNRREVWSSKKNHFLTINLPSLHVNDEENLSDEFKFVKKNLEFFDNIWFDDKENLLKTIFSILLIKGYLESKNIDFIMFEGISTIGEQLNFDFNERKFKTFLNQSYRENLLKDKTFFNKYGPMQPFDRTHPLFDEIENGGHPNTEFVKWWVDEMYEHIKENQ